MVIYVAHKGDAVVAVGTRDEVARKLGVRPDGLYAHASERARERWREGGNRLVLDRVEVGA